MVIVAYSPPPRHAKQPGVNFDHDLIAHLKAVVLRWTHKDLFCLSTGPPRGKGEEVGAAAPCRVRGVFSGDAGANEPRRRAIGQAVESQHDTHANQGGAGAEIDSPQLPNVGRQPLPHVHDDVREGRQKKKRRAEHQRI